MNISDKTMAQLRSEGCMVIVWTPEEIGNANFRVSQDQIVQFGNQIFDDQKDDDLFNDEDDEDDEEDDEEDEIGQFKQSCAPAFPKIGSISLTPRSKSRNQK